jgi:hypothetical protein
MEVHIHVMRDRKEERKQKKMQYQHGYEKRIKRKNGLRK